MNKDLIFIIQIYLPKHLMPINDKPIKNMEINLQKINRFNQMQQSNQSIVGKQLQEFLKQPPMQRVIITDIDDGRLTRDKSRIKILAPHDIIIHQVLFDILTTVYDIVLQNKLTSRYLSNYSASFIKSYIGENIDTHIAHVKKYDTLQQQQQPENIKGDNMEPGSTMVEEKGDVEGLLKESDTERVGRKLSTTSKYSKTLSNRTGLNVDVINRGVSLNDLVKLNEKNCQIKQLSEINDPYVQELRRLKQLNPKVEQTKKRDKKSFLGEKMRLLQKISYDFTGDIIKIKQLNQNSTLFTTPIQSIQNQGQITKHHEVTKPTDLDSHRTKKDRLASKNSLIQHTNNISFSNIRSLTPHLEIIDNARFIQGKTIVENKKTKEPSLIEIKKSMSLNKISRSQFSKLKDINNISKPFPIKASIPSLPLLKNQQTQLLTPMDKQFTDRQSKDNRQQIKQRERKEIRSLTKSNNGRDRITDRSYERVSVENEQLTEMLIYNKERHWIDARGIDSSGGQSKQELTQNSTNNQTQLQQLTPRDIANLHYIKTAGTIGALQLPKIPTVISNPNSILQSKSKIKSKQQQNEMQRLKKHFEDKLRV